MSEELQILVGKWWELIPLEEKISDWNGDGEIKWNVKTFVPILTLHLRGRIEDWMGNDLLEITHFGNRRWRHNVCMGGWNFDGSRNEGLMEAAIAVAGRRYVRHPNS